MKTCTKCKAEKQATEFSKAVKEPDGLQSWCRLCQHTYATEHAKEMRAYRKAWCEGNRNITRRLVRFYKWHGCSRCPEKRFPCLDLHHRDPAEKVSTVSLLMQKGRTPAVVWAEIQKCAVICANCHRIEHAHAE